MDINILRKYAGKRVYLILKNNYRYTTSLPDTIQDTFTIQDKFGKELQITADFVAFVNECDE